MKTAKSFHFKNMKQLFQTSSVVESISTRADNTLKIVCGTQELTPEQATILFGLKGKQGWLLFSENSIETKDVPEEQAVEFKTDRSASQRLRNTLFVYWSTNTGKTKLFDVWYKEWIEKKIAEIKDYLPEQK